MFDYDEAVTERYPTIRAGVVHATGLSNGPSQPELLLDGYRAQQRATLERAEETAIADLPSITACRRAFTRFGVKPSQYRNAGEALLLWLSKHGDIPTITTLVESVTSSRSATPCPSPCLTGPT